VGVPTPDPWLELLDEGRAREAGAARARSRWLRASAEADVSLVGALLDLAERGSAVVVGTTAGRVHQAAAVALGEDVVVLRLHDGLVLVPLAAVAWVRPVGDPAPAGTRAAPGGPRLVDLLGRSGERGDRVVLTLAGGATVAGRLEAAGADVVRMRTDGAAGGPAYVSVASIREAAVFRSG
jgi:hypothetical protein